MWKQSDMAVTYDGLPAADMCTHNSDAQPAHRSAPARVWELSTGAQITTECCHQRLAKHRKMETCHCDWHINPILIVTLKGLTTRHMIEHILDIYKERFSH